MQITGLYIGKLEAFGPRGKPSGINKQAINRAILNELGFKGDHQADKRHHGGPERAVHQYALSSYATLRNYCPTQQQDFVPGSIGENLSAPDMHDDTVCIGDIYQIGDAQLQVASPRMPCWKIDHKYGIPGLHKYIAKQAITGWYYRVLQEGELKVGDEITLLNRLNPELSVQRTMQIRERVDCTQSDIQMAARAEGLDREWKNRFNRLLSEQ